MITTRLMGAEIEYLGDSGDAQFDYVNEYYRGMREVNSILLPGSNILDSLMILKDIIKAIDDKTVNKIGTNGWVNSYGMAYNGVHLHLSGSLSRGLLERNILRLINKHGFSPRTVTSWHIFNRPTKYNFKNKNKHVPIYKTPRNTLEIRILDIEYFITDDIIKDLAIAIEYAYNGKETEGDYSWASRLQDIPMEDYKACCKFLDKNMAKWWTKRGAGYYMNTNGGYLFKFKELEGWTTREAPAAEEVAPEPRRAPRMASRARSGSSDGNRPRDRGSRSTIFDTSYSTYGFGSVESLERAIDEIRPRAEEEGDSNA